MYSKGAFITALLGLAQSNSSLFAPYVRFVWAGVNTAIALRYTPKQPDRDLLEEVTNSGAVCLW